MADYRRVCAIDAGTRNFAYCIIDNTNWRAPLHWKKEDLWAPRAGRRQKPTKQDIVSLTVAWCRKNKAELDLCDTIVLENQLRTPFIMMNTVIQALFYEKTTVVHPMTVGAFFGLPKTREQKKAAAIRVVQQYGAVLPANSKSDDLADAWLMAVHQMVLNESISEQEFS